MDNTPNQSNTFKGTITIAPVPPPVANANNNNKEIDNAKYIDAKMSMYNLIEHRHNYSKT